MVNLNIIGYPMYVIELLENMGCSRIVSMNSLESLTHNEVTSTLETADLPNRKALYKNKKSHSVAFKLNQR